MAGFNFKLEPILSLKRQLEDSKKNELGKAIQILETEKKVLKKLKEEKKRCMSEVTGKVSEGVTIDKLRSYNAYISFIEEKINKQSEIVKHAQENADKYREELVQIIKERKMLETLKEKQHAQYLKEQEKKYQKAIDEVISYKEATHKSKAED